MDAGTESEHTRNTTSFSSRFFFSPRSCLNADVFPEAGFHSFGEQVPFRPLLTQLLWMFFVFFWGGKRAAVSQMYTEC